VSAIKVLFLAANPQGTSPLKLDEEIRAITEKIRASEHHDLLDLVSVWAVRPDDLLQSLNEHKPQIVHFSGHGDLTGEIVLVDNKGVPKQVSTVAIRALFETLKDNIRVVFLNACYSRTQAEAITNEIDCAIGMKTDIGDQAAITFAASFYRAIGFGRSVQEAFEQGRVALLLEGISDDDVPELICKSGVDPNKVLVLEPQTQNEDDYLQALKQQVKRIEDTYGKKTDNIYEILMMISNSPDLYTCAEILRRINDEQTKGEIVRVLESSSMLLRPRKQSLLLAYILSEGPTGISKRPEDGLLPKLGNPEVPKLMGFFGAPHRLIKLIKDKIHRRFTDGFLTVDCGHVWLGTDQDEIDRILSSGSTAPEYIQIEYPKHKVAIVPFGMARFAVTNFEYSLYDEGHHYPENEDSYPATDLTWKNALGYANWWGARLSNEAEWVAAATGAQGYTYPWGNEYRRGLCNCEDTGIRHKLPVDSFPEGVSQFGCNNMSGNCWEMTSSLLRPFPYDSKDGRENVFLDGNRVIKGGSYSSKLPNIRCNARDYRGMDTPNSKVGFRLALDK